ncbi:MAG: cupredoxin domain-containing protein [Patescibacteria group bacterium]
MGKNTTIIVVAVLVVVVAGLLGWYFLREKPLNENLTQMLNTSNSVAVVRPEAKTVWIMEGSFNPSVVTIAAGETITWVNKDETKRKIAADPHPSGSTLPALLSEELGQNESYTFTFATAGTWGYHDYLNPIKSGQIIVK